MSLTMLEYALVFHVFVQLLLGAVLWGTYCSDFPGSMLFCLLCIAASRDWVHGSRSSYVQHFFVAFFGALKQAGL